jgi:hypothetical protein
MEKTVVAREIDAEKYKELGVALVLGYTSNYYIKISDEMKKALGGLHMPALVHLSKPCKTVEIPGLPSPQVVYSSCVSVSPTGTKFGGPNDDDDFDGDLDDDDEDTAVTVNASAAK